MLKHGEGNTRGYSHRRGTGLAQLSCQSARSLRAAPSRSPAPLHKRVPENPLAGTGARGAVQSCTGGMAPGEHQRAQGWRQAEHHSAFKTPPTISSLGYRPYPGGTAAPEEGFLPSRQPRPHGRARWGLWAAGSAAKSPSTVDPLGCLSVEHLTRRPQQHGWLLPLPRRHPRPFSAGPGMGHKPTSLFFGAIWSGGHKEEKKKKRHLGSTGSPSAGINKRRPAARCQRAPAEPAARGVSAFSHQPIVRLCLALPWNSGSPAPHCSEVLTHTEHSLSPRTLLAPSSSCADILIALLWEPAGSLSSGMARRGASAGCSLWRLPGEAAHSDRLSNNLNLLR